MHVLCVRGERCPRPLMTNTVASQGSDNSPKKSAGKHSCRCNYGSCSYGDQPQLPTISGATCTQSKPCLRCMDACVSTNGPAWSVNRFNLMVRRGIKCVHLPDLFLSDGNMKGRHQMCPPAVDPPWMSSAFKLT